MHGLLMVGLGGTVGAVLRYGAVSAMHRLTGAAMPWGTLFVNVSGSLALGVLLVATERMEAGETVRRFAAVGLLGAFTTFSAFSWEVVAMLRDGEWMRAVVYAAGSVVLGILALAAGVQIAGGLGSEG